MSLYAPAESATDPRETTIAAWVSRELADELAQLAKTNDSSMSREIRIAVRRHLQDARRGALTLA